MPSNKLNSGLSSRLGSPLKYFGGPVMGIELLVYCPPMEEGNEDVTGWEKETIEYVSSHRSKIYAQIRGIAKSLRKHNLQTTDVEDIYSDILMYLYNCDDYNISKAIERSSTSTIVSLEGYLNSCIRCCVMRHCTTMYKEEGERVRDIYTDDDGKELSIFDSIADTRSTDHIEVVLYDLESLCKSYEIARYKYGPDIYLIWYIRLLTLSTNNNLYKDILNILGISKKELSNIEKNAAEDELITTFAKAVNLAGVDKAISIIRPYIFSANKIDKTISEFS